MVSEKKGIENSFGKMDKTTDFVSFMLYALWDALCFMLYEMKELDELRDAGNILALANLTPKLITTSTIFLVF